MPRPHMGATGKPHSGYAGAALECKTPRWRGVLGNLSLRKDLASGKILLNQIFASDFHVIVRCSPQIRRAKWTRSLSLTLPTSCASCARSHGPMSDSLAMTLEGAPTVRYGLSPIDTPTF